MDVQPDFRDLLKSFNDHGFEYLIVGAYALAFHGAPRFTGDIDVYVNPTAGNADRVINALTAFGFDLPDLGSSDFQTPEMVVQLGVPPVRIDLLTSISGVTWEDAAPQAVKGTFGDIPVRYIGRDQYVTNKRASGRKKDLADIEALGEDLP